MRGLHGFSSRQRICGRCRTKRTRDCNATTTPGIITPGSWLSFLLGLVSVLGQESEQVGVVRAGQDALAIQGIVADDVGEGGRGLVCRICADGFPDGVEPLIDLLVHRIVTLIHLVHRLEKIGLRVLLILKP